MRAHSITTLSIERFNHHTQRAELIYAIAITVAIATDPEDGALAISPCHDVCAWQSLAVGVPRWSDLFNLSALISLCLPPDVQLGTILFKEPVDQHVCASSRSIGRFGSETTHVRLAAVMNSGARGERRATCGAASPLQHCILGR